MECCCHIWVDRVPAVMWGKTLIKWQSSHDRHSLAPPFQTFTSWTSHDTSTETNHSHFLRIPNIKKKFYGTNSFVNASFNTTILITSRDETIVFYLPYLHNLNFLSSPFLHITYLTRYNHLNRNSNMSGSWALSWLIFNTKNQRGYFRCSRQKIIAVRASLLRNKTERYVRCQMLILFGFVIFFILNCFIHET